CIEEEFVDFAAMRLDMVCAARRYELAELQAHRAQRFLAQFAPSPCASSCVELCRCRRLFIQYCLASGTTAASSVVEAGDRCESPHLSALEGPWPDHKPGLHPDEGGRSLR